MNYIIILKASQVNGSYKEGILMCKNIYILGGGASGMFAAIHAALYAKEHDIQINISIIEANDKLGKKILSTGNGHCNITNTNTNELTDKYHCDDIEFIKNVFKKYSNIDTMDTFQKFGILLTNKNGYIYPNSMQASTVSETLISYCQLLGVQLLTGTVIKQIIYNSDTCKFHITAYSDSGSSKVFLGDKILIACGSKAGVKNDYSYSILQNINELGHKVKKYLPALCSVYIDNHYKEFFKYTSGVRSEIKATLNIEHQITDTCHGELQLTDYGLSGIVIFQLSGYISRALDNHQMTEITIDFLPQYTIDELCSLISTQLFFSKKTLLDILSELLNKKLANALINLYSATKDNTTKAFHKSLTMEKLSDILVFIKQITFPVIGTNDFLHSQLCCGGISLKDVDCQTMESKIIKGLYFSGECLDVDGICGGYNLQWAWSTGYIAGRSMAND